MCDRDDEWCEPITLSFLRVGELENTLGHGVEFRSSILEKLAQRTQVLRARIASPGQPAAPGVIGDARTLSQISRAEHSLLRNLCKDSDVIQRDPTKTIRVETRDDSSTDSEPFPHKYEVENENKASARINQPMSLKTHVHLHELLGKPCADVFTLLRQAGPATAAELAQELGITPNGVRRHLKRLEDAGLVAHVVERRGRGRPTHRFQLRPAADRLVASTLLEAAIILIEHLLAEKNVVELRRYADVVITQLLGSIEGQWEPGAEAAGLATRYAALLQRLENAGFILSETGPGYEFCLSCPVGTLRRFFPQLCEAERKYFERFLGAPVQQILYGPNENIASCSFRVEAAVQ